MSALPSSQQPSICHRVWRRLLFLSALPVGIFMPWISVGADQQQRPPSFSVPKKESAAAEGLASQLAALSPRVNREEARLLAECAYATATQLRRQYRMFGTPIFNNFLVHWDIRKRGYCFQWAEDLLVTLDALKLTSLELHWGEANPGNWRENNCIVVTAKGQPFNRGIILTAGDNLDIFAMVRSSATLIRTSKTARTRASSAPDRQQRPIIISHYRRRVKRERKKTIRSS